MKLKLFCIVIFGLITTGLTAQTFHSNVQIDAKKTWNYYHGVSHDNITFTIDLINNKFYTSLIPDGKNLTLVHLDSRIFVDEKGQKVYKSKYEVQNNGSSFGLTLRIEDFKNNIQSELIVGKFNKSLSLELIKDGECTSFLACSLTELSIPIKYDPKTVWCQYQQSHISDYREVFNIEEDNNKGKINRSDVLVEIDTINHYVSLNHNNGFKISFVEKGSTTHRGCDWKFKKYTINETESLVIYETDSSIQIDNKPYNLIYSIKELNSETKNIVSSTDLYSSTFPRNQEENTDYLMEKPDGGE